MKVKINTSGVGMVYIQAIALKSTAKGQLIYPCKSARIFGKGRSA